MSVFLNNLDDFIAPSQACVNPLVSSRLTDQAKAGSDDQGGSNAGRIVLSNDFSKSDFDEIPVMPNLIKSKPGFASSGGRSGNSSQQQVATVSLNDCLACSGCVTSAEAVLIQEQGYEKLLQRIGAIHETDSLPMESDDGVKSSSDSYNSGQRGVIVVALSPNSTASIAQQLGLEYADCFLRVASLLKSLGVQYVIDAAAAGDVALIEAREEFLTR